MTIKTWISKNLNIQIYEYLHITKRFLPFPYTLPKKLTSKQFLEWEGEKKISGQALFWWDSQSFLAFL